MGRFFAFLCISTQQIDFHLWIFPRTTSFSNPAITDLIEIWPKTIDQQDYAKQIFSQIEKVRKTASEKAKAWNKSNIT